MSESSEIVYGVHWYTDANSYHRSKPLTMIECAEATDCIVLPLSCWRLLNSSGVTTASCAMSAAMRRFRLKRVMGMSAMLKGSLVIGLTRLPCWYRGVSFLNW